MGVRVYWIFLRGMVMASVSVLDSVNQRTQLAGRNRLELLLFRCNKKQRYGINVFKVREVILCPQLQQIPHSHADVRGVIQVRGKIFPVIDLGRVLGSPLRQPDSTSLAKRGGISSLSEVPRPERLGFVMK